MLCFFRKLRIAFDARFVKHELGVATNNSKRRAHFVRGDGDKLVLGAVEKHLRGDVVNPYQSAEHFCFVSKRVKRNGKNFSAHLRFRHRRGSTLERIPYPITHGHRSKLFAQNINGFVERRRAEKFQRRFVEKGHHTLAVEEHGAGRHVLGDGGEFRLLIRELTRSVLHFLLDDFVFRAEHFVHLHEIARTEVKRTREKLAIFVGMRIRLAHRLKKREKFRRRICRERASERAFNLAF